MKIGIPYKRCELQVEIPEKISLEIILPHVVSSKNMGHNLLQALENPLNFLSLKEFLDKTDEVLCIVNDATRPTPTGRIIGVLHEYIKRKNCKFLIATGTHRAPTPCEMRLIFGNFYEIFKKRIAIHDSRDKAELVKMGVSASGNEIWINRRVAEAKKMIAINSVEPHYFAGYTGGRKSFFPGVAGYQTVEENHRFALKKEACSLKLAGNPVHEDMENSMGIFNPEEIFSIQTVLDRNHEIYSVFAGNIHDAFRAATKKADEVFLVKADKKADIVIVVVQYPKDVNLYQCQNSIENGKKVLKEGGILIVVSSCWDGIGPSNFFNLLSECSNYEEVLERIHGSYKLGFHKAARYAETLKWAEIWAVTDLPDINLESISMRPFPRLQEAVNAAVGIKGDRSHIIVLMDGDKTVPVI